MENFLILKDTEKFKILTEEHIFEPEEQLELLFDIHSRFSWKNKLILYKKINSNQLILKWLKLLKKWAQNGNKGKKEFILKSLYFTKLKSIKKHIKSAETCKKEFSGPIPKTSAAGAVNTDKIKNISIKNKNSEIKKLSIKNISLNPEIKKISIFSNQKKEPEKIYIKKNREIEKIYLDGKTKEIKPFYHHIKEKLIKERELGLKRITEKKSKKISYEILDIIKELEGDNSSSIQYLTATTLASLALQSDIFLNYWKKLLKSGNQGKEYIAIAGAGELLSSKKDDIKKITTALKNYYEAPTGGKGIKKLKKSLEIKLKDPALLLSPLGAYQVNYPHIAEKVIKRDFSSKSCAINILKSFSYSLIYINTADKKERLKKAEKIYDRFLSLKEKLITPHLYLLKFSESPVDYEIFMTYFQVCHDFSCFGLYRAYKEMLSFLEYNFPENFKFELLSILVKTCFLCRSKFNFLEKSAPASLKSQTLADYIAIESSIYSLKRMPISYKTFDEIYKLIKNFKKVVEKFIEETEKTMPGDNLYSSIIRPFNFLSKGAFLNELPVFFNLVRIIAPDKHIILKNTEELFIKENQQFIKNSLISLMKETDNKEVQCAVINIAKKFTSNLDDAISLYSPLLSVKKGPSLNLLGEILGEYFKKIIPVSNKEDIIKYLRKMSYLGTSAELYKAISLDNPKWFLKLLNNFATFRKALSGEKDIAIPKLHSTLLSVKKELDKKSPFAILCLDLSRLLKCISCKDIYRSLEKLNIEEYSQENNFSRTIKNNIDNLKTYLMDFIDTDFISIYSKKETEKSLLKVNLEITKLENFLKEEEAGDFNTLILLVMKKILPEWKKEIISPSLKILTVLQKNFEAEDIEELYNNYHIIKNSPLFDNSQVKNLELMLQKYLVKLLFEKDNGETEKSIDFLIELQTYTSKDEPGLKSHDLMWHIMEREELQKLIGLTFSEYINELHKNQDYDSIIEFIYKMLENNAPAKIFTLTAKGLDEKKGPVIITSLLEAYGNALTDKFTIEKVDMLLRSLKEFKKNYSVEIAQIESYKTFLDMARSAKSLNSVSFVLDKIQERGNLSHSLYGCLEKNGFFSTEARLFLEQEEIQEESKQNQYIKNENTWIELTEYINKFQNNINSIQKYNIENVEKKIKNIKEAIFILKKIKNSVRNIKEPIARKILINLYIDKLIINREEEVDPCCTFSLTKLQERWEKIEKAIKNRNPHILAEEFYYRKDICNYLQFKEESLLPFKNFIVRWYYRLFEYDKGLYLQYMDKTHKEIDEKEFSPSSPFDEEIREEKSASSIFIPAAGALLFIFLLLPVIIGTQSPSAGSAIFKILFTIALAGSLVLPGVYLILYKLKKLDYMDIYIFTPLFLTIILPLLFFMSLNDNMWLFGITINDITFLIFSALLFVITLFFICREFYYSFSSKGESGEIIKKTLTFTMRGLIESFIISLVISTLLSNNFTIISGKDLKDLFFFFGTLQRGIPVSLLFTELYIYPSLIYSWTFIGFFFCVFKLAFERKKYYSDE